MPMSTANQSRARRLLAVSALEAGGFRFAVGCLVQFWAGYVKWTGEGAGLGDWADALVLGTLVALMLSETAAGFLGAALVERLERRKRFVAATGLATHGAWLAFAAAILTAPRAWLPLATFALVLWRGFFDGMSIAPWFDLAARVVPPADRARFFSVRLFAGATALPLGGMAAGAFFRVFEGQPRVCWALIFAAAGLAACAGDLVRLAYPEPAIPVDAERRRRALRSDLADFARLVLRDRRFLRLCVVTAAASMTESLYPYVLNLFALQRVGLTTKGYQGVVLLLQMSPLLACFLLPAYVRRLGWRRTYALLLAQFGAAFALMTAVALAFPGAPTASGAMVAAAMILAGLSGGWAFADANVLYAIVPDGKRPSFLVAGRAVANLTAVAVMLVLAALAGRELPYAAIFAGLTGAVALAAIFLLLGLRGAAEAADRPAPPVPARRLTA